MRISRLRTSNFRNLANIDVELGTSVVVVGENRAGKSNLLHAIRLVLDSALPNSERFLKAEDFSDSIRLPPGVATPMEAGEVIEISLEFAGFEGDKRTLALFKDALVGSAPATAKLTYRFSPRDPLEGETLDGAHPYDWIIFGGDREDYQPSASLRAFLHTSFMGALRDAEADIANWRRSPLRALLQAAAEASSDGDLQAAREAIEEANSIVGQLPEIAKLSAAVSDRTVELVGDRQALEMELAVGPVNPAMLIRSLRMFVDGAAHRPLPRASLGTLNVLYFALNEMQLEHQLDNKDIAHIVMAIDEPEAHLHPHLQRLIFHRLLRSHDANKTVIVTTQSPHVASAADPRSVIRLYGDSVTVNAASAASAALSEDEWNDVARYLDATRAELVFARRVLFVEGFAEQVMIPVLAQSLGLDLDKLGVTVCSVHGTHFSTYVRLAEALHIPWSVITDGDPDAEGTSAGENRALRLLERLGIEGDLPSDHGIFVGSTTFEVDLYTHGTENYLKIDRLLGASADEPPGTPSEPNAETLLKRITAFGGKGRAAQRLATEANWEVPGYIEGALRFVCQGS